MKTRPRSNLFPLRSPLDGVVVDCKIVAGEIVDTSSLLFVVTDLRAMWLMLDARQDDARYLSPGQSVLFHPTEAKDEPEIKGTVSWISTAADDKTRTVKVRCDLPNPSGQLRANTFGLGRIVLRTEPQAIVVPTEAVHSDGDCNIVFVRDKNFFGETAHEVLPRPRSAAGGSRRQYDRNHRRRAAGRSCGEQKQRGFGSTTAEEQPRRRLRMLCGGKKINHPYTLSRTVNGLRRTTT